MWFSHNGNFYGYLDGTTNAGIALPAIFDGQWHHILWRRSNTQSCLFVDATQQGCTAVTNKTLEIESLILGQEQDSVSGGFDIDQDWEGIVDELLIYREALSNAEIQSLYNNQNAGNNWNGSARTCQTTPPQPPATDYGYSDWRFDEESWNGTANEVKDSHAGHHGTAHSIPAVSGKTCNAMDLRKSSTKDYVKLGEQSLDGVEDFTVSIWHKGSSSKGKAVLSGTNSNSRKD